MRRNRSKALAVLLVSALSPVLTPALPAAAEPPAIVVRGNATQPVFSRADAVKQTVFVEVAGTDSDRDGLDDRVAVDILRPKETEQGLKVPTIMEASPYYAGIDSSVPNHPVDVDENGEPLPTGLAVPTERKPIVFAGYYDNYFLPRGYAIALVENLGSGRATGCPTTGDRNETAGPKAAVDWLNGRARGFDGAGRPVSATWSTGNVGMIGTSYNGTLPNAVAATGVQGLKTIVPIAAISSWYDYYRAGGGVVAPGGYQGEDADVLAKAVLTRQDKEICRPVVDELTAAQDRTTGDYSPFWAARDYLSGVRDVRASVFVVHGLNDWNVKTKQFAQWWERLRVPKKIWLHMSGHRDPWSLRAREWFRQLHGWFDHFLYGLDTDILREPAADVETAPGVWAQHRTWPVPGALPVSLWPAADGRLSPLPRPGLPAAAFTDQKERTAEQLAAGAPAADPNRLAWVTTALPTDTRISGTPSVTVRAALRAGASPYLTALLVDYGTAKRPTGGTVSAGETWCYGESVPGDSGCLLLRRHELAETPFKIVTRGWLDVRNRNSVSESEPIQAGRFYTFRWDLQPNDYVFAQGHRIGLVLLSTDRDFTLRYPAGTVVEVAQGLSSIKLPVVFGRVP